MKRKLFILSVSLNIVLSGILCFGAYYKRDSIGSYANRIYNVVFNNNDESFEKTLLEFYQRPYQTNIKYKNIDQYEKKIKLAILGNSISLHGIIEGLWEYESGMAASDLEHDYVHVLLNKISEEKQRGIEYIVINIFAFERDFENFDQNQLEIIREFEPEIIIFQIGENVVTKTLNEKRETFIENYIELIKYCNGKNAIICLPFWLDRERLNAITEVALKSGSYLVDLSHLGSGIEPLNFARSERKFDHAGVGAHPGDYGMENIAKVLYITINKIIE